MPNLTFSKVEREKDNSLTEIHRKEPSTWGGPSTHIELLTLLLTIIKSRFYLNVNYTPMNHLGIERSKNI